MNLIYLAIKMHHCNESNATFLGISLNHIHIKIFCVITSQYMHIIYM